jgi:hypothetical protein
MNLQKGWELAVARDAFTGKVERVGYPSSTPTGRNLGLSVALPE